MKKNSSRGTKSKQKNAQSRSSMTKIHVLIAVVAIIECLILISFTTYSWIESASSLIIETGKRYYDDTVSTRIPIANALTARFIISPSGNDVSDLNNYFSYSGQSRTQNLYRYARASSPNGKDFYFKNSGLNGSGNSTTGSTGNYRAGDYIDINSNYTYFDFVLENPNSGKYKFYFADANVFTVTNDEGSSLTQAQLDTIRDAMRISFQTGSGTPKIYSRAAASYNAVGSTSGSNAAVTTTAIESNQNQKLFTIGKGTSANPQKQYISIRIWLEEKASGISSLSGSQLAGAKISVNLQLAKADNNYDYLYFDDYTFSSGLENKENIGGHLTGDYDESNDYRMYFVYRTSDSTSGYVYPMTIDTSGSGADALSWVTCDSTGAASSTLPDTSSPNQLYVTNITTANHAALTYSYFAYGKCATTAANTSVTLSSATNALYTWKLDAAGSDDAELRYNAYSATSIKAKSTVAANMHASSNQSNAPKASIGYGCGGWAYTTPLSMVYFRDLATGVTANAYSEGNNFKYITERVNTASDDDGRTDTHRNNVMYVNKTESTVATSMTEAKARETATMYYDRGLDTGNGLFKSWVPSSWLTSANTYFHYCCGTYYNNVTTGSNWSVINWTAPAATKPANSNYYIYTALGYNTTYTVDYYSGNSSAATGVGCWNAIESQPVYFSTELIDNVVTSANRYQIGVKINGSSSASYYNLIPDETGMKFYAFIPVPGTNANPGTDYAAGAIVFRATPTHNASVADADLSARWYGNVRNGSRTYYPVAFSNANAGSSSAPRGYWNLAVIVDGTYEHFFWDYGDDTTSNDDQVLGEFEYNTTGHVGNSVTYTTITPNMIDEYRWYVPFDSATIGAAMPESVYFKWTPYAGADDTYGTTDDTVFKYSHYRSDGIYCVITEAADNTPANAFS